MQMLPLLGQWPLERGGKHFQGAAPCGYSPHGVGTCHWGVTILSSSWAPQWFGLTVWEPQVKARGAWFVLRAIREKSVHAQIKGHTFKMLVLALNTLAVEEQMGCSYKIGVLTIHWLILKMFYFN